MKNIVLTGLSGCGKTTLGKLLATALDRPYYDMDAMIEEHEGKTVKEIFAQQGEDHFRQVEADIAQQAANLTDAVISTGGGVILRQSNMDHLRRTGVVIFIDRDPHRIIQSIEGDDRPLLADGAEKLYQLAQQRRTRYLSTAHHIMENNGDSAQGLDNLLRLTKDLVDF